MSYSDAGQVAALRELGVDAILFGSDEWMLGSLTTIPRVAVFRGTHAEGSRVRRGVAYLVSLARLVRLVRRHRPDVIHWQYLELPGADLLAMIAIRALGVAQVYTAHELLPWTARPYSRVIMRAIYRVVDSVVVHRADQRLALIQRFSVAPVKVGVVGLGDYSGFADANLPQADARSRLGIPGGAPVALFFGAIRPSKGLEVLLAAWPDVHDAGPEAILVVAGKPYKGVKVTDLENAVRALGLGDRVRTEWRHVGPAETNDYYRAADVVVLPYHDIGTSGVLRYAYNSGRAVVATSVGEHPAHVVRGLTGELVPPGDPDALARALSKLLSDRDEAHRLGLHALEYATKEFAWSASAAQLLDEYRRLA